MKSKFQFIKNIILVVASALTLVAVTFAWFTSNFKTNIDQYEGAISGDAVIVEFYEQVGTENKYLPLSGDIELKDTIPGKYNSYKMLVTTKTADKLKLSFAIEGLPEDMSAELKKYVCISYTLYTTQVTEKADGSIAFTDKILLAKSSGYVPLSELENGKIFTGVSLAEQQTKAGNTFSISYTIGLSEDAPVELSGVESSLGNIKISAQRIG